MKAIEYKAPLKTDNLNITTKKIFLAGSIEMGIAEDWQKKIVNSLSDKDIIFFNPRRNDWDSSWKQSISNEFFVEQVDWELDHLEMADIIVIYFDPNTKSPISLLELGLHASSKKLIICCADGFWRKGNVDIVAKRYNIKVVETIQEIVDLLSLSCC